MKRTLLCALALLLGTLAMQAQKPALDHSVYDDWKSLSRPAVPYDGAWMYYTLSPQQGDGVLHVVNAVTGAEWSCPRATDFKISLDGTKAVYKIKPRYEETRQARIKKKKADQMPKDSLAILDLQTGSVEKFDLLNALYVPFELADWIAYTKHVEKKDSLLKKEDVIVLNIKTLTRDTLKTVTNPTFNRTGRQIAYMCKPGAKDSLRRAGVCLYDAAAAVTDTLLFADKKAQLGKFFWNEAGDRFAFYANLDTAKTAAKQIDVYTWSDGQVNKVLDHGHAAIPEGWKLSGEPGLGWRFGDWALTVGLCPIPMEKDTTLVDFEQPQLDIWTWNEDYLQSVQKLRVSTEKNRTYLSLLRLDDGSLTRLADEELPEVSVPLDFQGDRLLAWTDKPYRIKQQWDQDPCHDIYVVDLKDGSRSKVATAVPWTRISLSPDGNRYVFYDAVERAWMAYALNDGSLTNLTEGLGVNFYDEKDDHPCLPPPTGGATWFKDSRHVALRDRYDIWVVDVTGRDKPYTMTEGRGRAEKTMYYVTLPYSRPQYFPRPTTIDPALPVYFMTLNEVTKEGGVAVRDLSRRRSSLMTLASGPYKWDALCISRAPKKPVLFYTRESFETGRNLYASTDLTKGEELLCEANPQIRDYNWGTVELMKWTRADGIEADALVFKPEDFDPAKKYPVIFYFYEKDSQTMYSARNPAPSRSIVNIPWFVSNGYVVCDPDIYYKLDGHPGRDGLESVMAATDELCKNAWVDQARMGIQGQSWGGYQVAYIITQTDRYAAAGAGAPVSNMTSAYGGIRWGSGIVREVQYEQGQSRIGKDLWSGFDLYYDNSPVFFVPNVKTPVLIMANDNDGAVPWWQGIEFFTALRRCGKQAWMLQYNREAHNLNGRWNSKDLSMRLDQFFGHFLKDEPMPEWMEKGIPATKKGLTLGY